MLERIIFILLNIIIYNIIYLSLGKRKNLSFNAVFVLIFIFCLFPYWSGDYFHFKDSVEMAKKMIITNIDVPEEPIYISLANLLHGNYFIFRFILWGGGLVLICNSLKNLKLLNKNSLCIFACVSLLMYSYARAYIALSFLMWGVSYFYSSSKKQIIKWLLLLITCAISIYFHRSAIIPVLFVIINVFLKPTNRNLLIFAIVFSLLLLSLRQYINAWIDSYTALYESDLDIGMNRAYEYIAAEKEIVWSPSYILNFILTYAPLLYGFVFFVKNHVSEQRVSHKPIDEFVNIYIYIAMASFAILLIGIGSWAIFYRVANMVFIPLAFILAFNYNNGTYIKQTKVILTMLFVWSNYSLIYSLYNYITG